jgi:structural maintenance of chromosome 4
MSSDTRLIITGMLFENFKSYSGVHYIGPFHERFTSIVGPNGSGKSNVIDALQFVFTKRAKQLRLNKLSELIHNSNQMKNVPLTKVDVFFMEILEKGKSENTEFVPGSEFIITRIVDCDCKSDYYINYRTSTMFEVTKLLKNRGIDLCNGRYLILQGEVEQISTLKPKGSKDDNIGLLEYLEDIVGTNEYLAHIQELTNKFDQVLERRALIFVRIKQVERDRDRLEGLKLEIEALWEEERKLMLLTAISVKLLLHRKNSDKANYEIQKVYLINKFACERQKFYRYKLETEKNIKNFDLLTCEHECLSRELKVIEDKFKLTNKKAISCLEEINCLSDKYLYTYERGLYEEEKAVELEENDLKLSKELSVNRSKLASLLKKSEDSEKQMMNSTNSCEDLRAELLYVCFKLITQENCIQLLLNNTKLAHEEYNLIIYKQETVKIRINELECSIAKSRFNIYKKKKECQQAHFENNRCYTELNLAKLDANQLVLEENKILKEIQEAKVNIKTHQSFAVVEKNLSTVVKVLNSLRDEKKIPGLFGRLGDLGTIDAIYDIAVSTACPALDFIVVNTTSTALSCVDFLRKNNYGFATFLILEKQNHLIGLMNEKIQTPESIPRLFDLIQVNDEKLRVGFYFGLRDCLVVNDLEHAIRIAYNPTNRRFKKIVTIKGELIQESGTISGGGSKSRGGKILLNDKSSSFNFSSEHHKEKLLLLNKKVCSLQNSISFIKIKSIAVNQLIQRLNRVDQNLRSFLQKLDIEINTEEKKVTEIELQIKEKRRSMTHLTETYMYRKNELEKIILHKQKELDNFTINTSNLLNKAQMMENRIGKVCEELSKNQTEVNSRLDNSIKELRETVFKQEVKSNMNSKKIEKIRFEIKKNYNELEKADFEIKKKKEKSNLIEKQNMIVKQKLKKMETSKSFKQDELDFIIGNIDKNQGFINAIKASKATTWHKIKDIYSAKNHIITEINDQKRNLIKKIGEINEFFARDGLEPEQIQQMISNENQLILISAINLHNIDNRHINSKTIKGCTCNHLTNLGKSNYLTHKSYLNESIPATHNLENVNKNIICIEAALKMKKKLGMNFDSIEEYKRKEVEYIERNRELDGFTAERDTLLITNDKICKQRLDKFLLGFSEINLHLKQIYQMITFGGDAELELIDSLDPFTEGINFSVRPPKKSWKIIANLSGGEKTLSSFSLVLALHHYKPTPFYVMDEIDAALDHKNVSVVGHFIKEQTYNAQFIVISLRNNMFELADRLIGIYKTENNTKSLVINPVTLSPG